MFDAIRKLGCYIIENENLEVEDTLVEKSKMRDANIVCAVFELNGKNVAFDQVHLEKYDSERSTKYLYRTLRHGRYDVTPTTRIISPDKVKDRAVLWFKKYAERQGDWLIQALKDEITRKADEIFAEVSRKYNELVRENRRNLMFTMKIKEGEKEKYLGDYEIFRRVFEEESTKPFFAKYNVESKSVATCHLCGKNKEVFGFASPFSFYTFDKRGFAPNFIREEAWKRAPTCAECAISLEAGKQFLDQYLLKDFYGFRFYVIPKFIFEDVNADLIEDIKDANKRNYAESLLCVEDDILDLMKEKKNTFGLIFMFIRPKQKDFFDIVKYVEDVPPSWIKKIYDALKETEAFSLAEESSLKKILGKKHVGGLRGLTIGGLIRLFFPSPNYDKNFIDVVGDILAQRKVDKDLLIKAFTREIRNMHVNKKGRSEKILCLKSFILLLLLHKLELIEHV